MLDDENYDLDSDWNNFISNSDNTLTYSMNTNIIDDNIPKCSELYISTSTIISYLNVKDIDIQKIFWKIPILNYETRENGVIKKQIKFSTTDKEDSKIIENHINNTNYIDVQVIEYIDNPEGRIKYKDQRKISVGLCKKDILSYRSKKKRAFFNCFVLIFRLFDEKNNTYKEMHVKVFNTGKIEIPGVQCDKILEKIINLLIHTLKPYLGDDLSYDKDKNETVLVNSNFNCGYYIDRDKFHDILKYKYRINSSFDSCSYPGIQCKFYYLPNKIEQSGQQPSNNEDNIEISFMVFRTGSILIVGKCQKVILNKVYDKLKNILTNEYREINVGVINLHEQNKNNVIKKIKKIRKKTLYFV